MTYARIDPRLWDDEAFVGLDDLTRTVWWVLLAGPQVTALPGLQRASAATIADTLRRSVESVETSLTSLERLGLIRRDVARRVVQVVNAPRYNRAESPNHVKAWWRRYQEIPDCELKTEHVALLQQSAGLESEGHRLAWAATFGRAARNSEQPSRRPPEGLVEPSRSPPEGLAQALRYSVSASASASASASPPTPSGGELALAIEDPKIVARDPVAVLFELWATVHGHARAKLDGKRRRRIARVVADCGVETVRRAILGAREDGWLMGLDPKGGGRRYDGIETILRDAAQVERLAELHDAAEARQRGADASQWIHDGDAAPEPRELAPPDASLLGALRARRSRPEAAT